MCRLCVCFGLSLSFYTSWLRKHKLATSLWHLTHAKQLVFITTVTRFLRNLLWLIHFCNNTRNAIEVSKLNVLKPQELNGGQVEQAMMRMQETASQEMICQ